MRRRASPCDRKRPIGSLVAEIYNNNKKEKEKKKYNNNNNNNNNNYDYYYYYYYYNYYCCYLRHFNAPYYLTYHHKGITQLRSPQTVINTGSSVNHVPYGVPFGTSSLVEGHLFRTRLHAPKRASAYIHNTYNTNSWPILTLNTRPLNAFTTEVILISLLAVRELICRLL